VPDQVKHSVRIARAQDGERLDRALAETMAGELSRSRIQALLRAGMVSDAEGRPVTDPDARVKAGQTFAIVVPESAQPVPRGQEIPLEVVYEDDDVIVIDKPAGLVVHPAPGNPDRTLVNGLIAHCGGSLSGIGGVRRPGIVHRLDKDTSGLMVAAKNDRAHAGLAAQFKARKVDRAYRAVVWGVPRPRAGRIEGNIGRHPRNRKKMAVVTRGGKAAATNYRTLSAFGESASLVECRLETGRTHQIRVHMASRGHPVIGDPLYGGGPSRHARALDSAAAAAAAAFDRQALHACLLGFDHPRTGQRLTFESQLPYDICDLAAALAGQGKERKL